jgi:hypothetical protein
MCNSAHLSDRHREDTVLRGRRAREAGGDGRAGTSNDESTGRAGLPRMRHTIYEDPVTHRFALLRLPERFVEGDKLPVTGAERWFETRDEAVAALPDLLNLEE